MFNHCMSWWKIRVSARSNFRVMMTTQYPLQLLGAFSCMPVFRLGMAPTRRTEDDQQSGEHLASESSCAVHDQVYAVTDLWLIQLPSQWQDVPTEHARHPARRQLGRHCRRQRLGLVEHQQHSSRLRSQRHHYAYIMIILRHHSTCGLFSCASVRLSFCFKAEWKRHFQFITDSLTFCRTLLLTVKHNYTTCIVCGEPCYE